MGERRGIIIVSVDAGLVKVPPPRDDGGPAKHAQFQKLDGLAAQRLKEKSIGNGVGMPVTSTVLAEYALVRPRLGTQDAELRDGVGAVDDDAITTVVLGHFLLESEATLDYSLDSL